MEKLLKMEKYQFLHNFVYWCGMIGIFVLGFFTADTYVPEVMGPAGGKASSLADIFNGMVYDSTFLLIIISGLLALSFGQEFSGRTITLEVSAGHSRSKIFTGKIISYLIAFHIMALVYPVAGCIREFGKFGMEDGGVFFYNVTKAIVYSLLLNSGIFLIAILICCYLQDVVRATSRIWNDAAIAGSVFTGLSDPGRCQQEHIFSAGCYSGRGDMVGHTDIAFMDKIS